MKRFSISKGCVAVLAAGLSVTSTARAINVSPSADANALVSALVGNNSDIQIVPNSATLTSFQPPSGDTTDSASAGSFTNADFAPFSSGILLSTGGINNVVGPNTQTDASQANGLAGDPDLDKLITPNATMDATVLTFQFKTTTKNQISFQYFFGSEEYPEFVGQFNDVFGFFLNGKNIALIPGTTDPVSIDSINDGTDNTGPAKNINYYFNNNFQDGTAPANTELDGLVGINKGFPLFATGTVVPGEVNTIKLAIADAVDQNLDTDVFLAANSFIAAPPPPPPTGAAVPLPAGASMGLALLTLLAVGRAAGASLRRRAV